MFLIAKYALFASIIGSIMPFHMKDDLPVLEHLGCGDCPRVYAPLCGTDDKTYTNLCRLNCKNSKRKPDQWVYMKRFGPCLDTALFE